jgi:hypothetical protein
MMTLSLSVFCLDLTVRRKEWIGQISLKDSLSYSKSMKLSLGRVLVLLFLSSCASSDNSRNIASEEFLTADELEEGLRFGAEWTFSSQEMGF